MGINNKIGIRDLFFKGKLMWKYLMSKALIIISIGLFGGIIGVFFAWKQKPLYTAELTFTPETGSSSRLGSYAGLAAQFGLDMGSGGNIFEGDNIVELFKSRTLLEKTLESNIPSLVGHKTLIDYYISVREYNNKKLLDSIKKNKIDFSIATQKGTRLRDSIMKLVIRSIVPSLVVERIDKKLNILSVAMTSGDEAFSKIFVEELTRNAITYYTGYKSEKARQNVEVLQYQADSVKRMLFGGMANVAELNDLNINPLKQTARVGSQYRTVDVQVNGAIYTEILKNLEIAKITLRKETPFIQVIDRPSYPLEKKKLGRLLTGIIGAFLAGCFTVFVLVFKKSFL